MRKTVQTLLILICATVAFAGCSAAGSTEDGHVHTIVLREAVAATCTETGNAAYYECAACHEFFEDIEASRPVTSDEVTIPATGHTLGTFVEAQEPTCTERGNPAYAQCAVCKQYVGENGAEYGATAPILAALGHDTEAHAGQEATCTEVGWAAYETCKRCDYTTYVEVPALGHDTEAHAGQEATCTEIGWVAYETCKRCDYTSYAELIALGHNWGEHLAHNEIEHFKQCARCKITEASAAHEWKDNVCIICSYDAGGSKGIIYTLIDGGTAYEVTGIGTCVETELVFPETYNGLPVVSIGNSAFKDLTTITSVVIPDSARTIGTRAFMGCTKLKYLDLGNGVQSINDFAFISTVLTELRIPASVRWIGSRAFYLPKSRLTSVIFEDPYGWEYSTNESFTSPKSISTETFSDPAAAAKYVDQYAYTHYFRKNTD